VRSEKTEPRKLGVPSKGEVNEISQGSDARKGMMLPIPLCKIKVKRDLRSETGRG
jgi:hypothetical protein